MSKHDSKEVSYVALHEPLHNPLVGDLGKTLTSKKTASTKSVKMTIAEPFLLVEATNPVDPKIVIKILVPITNCKSIVLA